MLTREIQIKIPTTMEEMFTQGGWNMVEYWGPLDMSMFVRHTQEATIYVTFIISTDEIFNYKVIYGGRR